MTMSELDGTGGILKCDSITGGGISQMVINSQPGID